MKKTNMKVACFGMSANPPHKGYLIAAKEILKKTPAGEIWFIPCWRHSFAKPLAKWEDRWNMVKLMTRPGIKASDIEFQLKGVSYTVNTVQALQKKYPEYEFFWVIGSDIVKDQSYKKWRDRDKLAKLIKFWVIQREGFEIGNIVLPSCFIPLPIKIPNISSTEIRECLKKGLSIKKLVTPEVENYIREKKLYLM